MKPRFFSGCHPEKNQIEFYPIFFRVAKAPIFSKLKIGCRLEGRILCCFCYKSKNKRIGTNFEILIDFYMLIYLIV